MSQKVTVTEGAYLPLTEAVAGALTGKEDQLLSLNNVGRAVLFDGSAPAVAVMIGKLSPDSTEVQARLIGKGGTVRMVQDAAITPGVRVAGKNATSRVQTAAAGTRSLGFKLSPTAGAAGDVIEVADVIETIPA